LGASGPSGPYGGGVFGDADGSFACLVQDYYDKNVPDCGARIPVRHASFQDEKWMCRVDDGNNKLSCDISKCVQGSSGDKLDCTKIPKVTDDAGAAWGWIKGSGILTSTSTHRVGNGWTGEVEGEGEICVTDACALDNVDKLPTVCIRLD
jgi:hypothetical protein